MFFFSGIPRVPWLLQVKPHSPRNSTQFSKKKISEKEPAKYIRHNTPQDSHVLKPSQIRVGHAASRLFSALETTDASWDTALVFGRINLYYLTGTIQDGVLVLRRNGEIQFFVRRIYEQAREEPTLDTIHPMKSYRDMQEFLPADLERTFVETDQVPVAVLDRLQKYFRLDVIMPLDLIHASPRGKNPV
ncbi:MAG: aminopeptidase P family N-terminal domain-containing protein [Methanocorpusculum sp.]|nr:aminopeptidase P family N-terminal domain-containing protein [Methanocorpusculum sp.]